MESAECVGGSSGYDVEPRAGCNKTTEYFVRHVSDVGSIYTVDSERDARLVMDLLNTYNTPRGSRPQWRAYKLITVIEETSL